LLGFGENLDAEDILLAEDSIGYQTYFAVDAINYRPAPLPDIALTDVAYVGAILLYAAGLPLPDSYAERLRLMKLCNGRYFDCPDQEAILSFQRRLVDSGLLHPR
jgi:hypothetical protein